MRRRWSLLWAARFIAKWEGFLPNAYLDTIASPAVWTIGYGHTPAQPGERWSRAKALRVLAADCRSASQAVAEYIDVPLTVRQRMALISFTFNCGPGALAASTLRRRLNARDYYRAGNELLRWDKAGGVSVWGLTRRRRAERRMFLSQLNRWRKWQR
jgi:lysozyme